MKRRTLTISITLLLVGLALWKGWDALTALPQYLNIGTERYNTALGRWRSQNIIEYELSAEQHSRMGGYATLKVSEDGSKIEIISSSSTPDNPNNLRDLTVEGMFEDVYALLNHESRVYTLAMLSEGPFSMYYKVSFNEDLGYPTSIEGHPYSAARQVVYDTDWKKTIVYLRVLKSGPPAMREATVNPLP